MMNALKSEMKELSSIERELSILVPSTELAKEAQQAYQRLAQKARIKGFRQGHVPRQVLEQYYAPQVEQEVLQKVVQKSYHNAVVEHNLHPISDPNIEPKGKFELGADFEYVVKIEIKPQIQLKKWEGLSCEAPSYQVGDAEVDKELDQLLESQATLAPVENRTNVIQGDLVDCEISGSIDGHMVKELDASNQTIEVGSGRFFVEAEQALVGKDVNAELQVDVTIPESFPKADLRGKTAKLKLLPKTIREKKKPALDDEFAKDVSERFETLADLKKAILESLTTEKDRREEDAQKRAVVDALIAANPFEVPASLVSKQTEYLAARMLTQFPEKQAVSLWQQIGEKLKEGARPEAERTVRGDLLLEVIAKEHSIKITDEDLDAEFQKEADARKMSLNALKSRYRSEDFETMRFSLANNRALALVTEKAKIKAVKKPWRENNQTNG